MADPQDTAAASPSSNLNSHQRTIILATTLSICIPLALGLLVFLFVYCRRRQRAKIERELMVKGLVGGSYHGRGKKGSTDSKTSSTTKLDPTTGTANSSLPNLPQSYFPPGFDPSTFPPNFTFDPTATISPQEMAALQSQYAQWAMYQQYNNYPHTHPRYTINTLSTITEASPFLGSPVSIGMSSPQSWHTAAPSLSPSSAFGASSPGENSDAQREFGCIPLPPATTTLSSLGTGFTGFGDGTMSSRGTGGHSVEPPAYRGSTEGRERARGRR